MPERQLSPTRSTLLELKDERSLVEESYEFLDEKSTMLAAEILRQLDRHRELLQRFGRLENEAVAALRAAVRRHGLDGASVYPPPEFREAELETTGYRFIGVSMVSAALRLEVRASGDAAASNPSPEARQCQARALALLELAAPLAAVAGNLYRLCAEYTKTERRARALENVMLPEIQADIAMIEEQLEAIEQEEALCVRNACARSAASALN